MLAPKGVTNSHNAYVTVFKGKFLLRNPEPFSYLTYAFKRRRKPLDGLA